MDLFFKEYFPATNNKDNRDTNLCSTIKIGDNTKFFDKSIQLAKRYRRRRIQETPELLKWMDKAVYWVECYQELYHLLEILIRKLSLKFRNTYDDPYRFQQQIISKFLRLSLWYIKTRSKKKRIISIELQNHPFVTNEILSKNQLELYINKQQQNLDQFYRYLDQQEQQYLIHLNELGIS